MKYLLLVTAFACLSTTQLRADEKSPAVQLVELLDPANSAQASAAANFQPLLNQMKAQGIPAEAQEEITVAFEQFLTDTFAEPDLITELAQVYEEVYTPEEIEQLLKFYNTPIGKKVLASTPELTQKSSKVSQKFAEKNQGAFQQKVQEIMIKHMTQQPSAE